MPVRHQDETDSDSGDEDGKWLDELLEENGVPKVAERSQEHGKSCLTSQPKAKPQSQSEEFVTGDLWELVQLGPKGKENGNREKVSLNIFNLPAQRNTLNQMISKEPEKHPDGKWEVIKAIMDSGATIPVFPPATGSGYQIEESAASRAGVECEIANGDFLPILGQKKIAVLTAEGTLRGYASQVADVSKPLNAVRSTVKSGHAVCFGLGPDGEDHLIINRHTGEINRLEDDGVNYLQSLLVVPQDQIQNVRNKLDEMQHGNPNNAGFAWQGP